MQLFNKMAAGIVLAIVMASASGAHDHATASIRVEQPFARATAGSVGGGFATIVNDGASADRLLAVEASISDTVELHTMTMEGDVMKMRKVDGIDVPQSGMTKLEPGGLHIMFIGLHAPLVEGQTFAATLVFATAGRVEVVFPIVAPGQGAGGHEHQ